MINFFFFSLIPQLHISIAEAVSIRQLQDGVQYVPLQSFAKPGKSGAWERLFSNEFLTISKVTLLVLIKNSRARNLEEDASRAKRTVLLPTQKFESNKQLGEISSSESEILSLPRCTTNFDFFQIVLLYWRQEHLQYLGEFSRMANSVKKLRQ